MAMAYSWQFFVGLRIWVCSFRKGLTSQSYYGYEIETITPRKINMEHNHGGLEDHVPFQMGDV